MAAADAAVAAAEEAVAAAEAAKAAADSEETTTAGGWTSPKFTSPGRVQVNFVFSKSGPGTKTSTSGQVRVMKITPPEHF